jgi:hypothetical protein
MEEQYTPPPAPSQGGHSTPPVQQQLPNATAVLVLGILSLVFICPYISLLGIVLGIIALVLANRDQNLYRQNPAGYALSSFNNMKAGRVCAIIGLSIATLTFVITVLFIIGIMAFIPFWGMIN